MNVKELDEAAANYFSDKGRIEERFITKSTLKLALPFVNKKAVLQLGLGNGFIAKQIDAMVSAQVVVEGSQKLVSEFNHPLVNTQLLHGFFENFSVNSKFDVVLANHVLEHVNDPVQVLTYLKGYLNKNGIVLITVPNATSLHRRIGVDMNMIKDVHELNQTDLSVGHQRVYDINSLRHDVTAAGYKIVKESGYLLKLVSLKKMEN